MLVGWHRVTMMNLWFWTVGLVFLAVSSGAIQRESQSTRRKHNAVDFVGRTPTVEFRRLPGGRLMTSESGHVRVTKDFVEKPKRLPPLVSKKEDPASASGREHDRRLMKRLAKKMKKMKRRLQYLEKSVLDLQQGLSVKFLPALQIPGTEIDVNSRGEIVWTGKNLNVHLDSNVLLRDQTALVVSEDGLYAAAAKLGNVTVALRVTSQSCSGCKESVRNSCTIGGAAASVFHLKSGDRVSVQVCWRRLLSVPLHTIQKAELWLRMM